MGNPGKVRAARRRLTPAQIQAGFGGARRREALKRTNSAKRAKRRAPAIKAHSTRSRPRRMVRNPGEILGLTLANPATPRKKKKGKTMAKTSRKNSGSRRPRKSTTRHNRSGHFMTAALKHHRRRSTRRNPAPRSRRRSVRRNPGERGGVSGLFTNALFVIAGAVGSKVITQAVLRDKNTGIMGYVGNGATGVALSLLASKAMKNRAAGHAILAGSVVQIVLRAIGDYTPFGKYVQNLGMGDYLASNWVTPQRYTDALNSANVETPQGWAPTTVVAAPGKGPGMAGYTSLYSNSGGLYN